MEVNKIFQFSDQLIKYLNLDENIMTLKEMMDIVKDEMIVKKKVMDMFNLIEPCTSMKVYNVIIENIIQNHIIKKIEK
jgi:hypothetical protein